METKGLRLAVIALGTAIALCACGGDDDVTPDSTHSGSPEPLAASCFHNWTQFFLQQPPDGFKTSPSGVLSGPGVTQDVPLYHDCQRFEKSDTAYGAFFAIFATGQVRNLPVLNEGKAIPVVQIFAWGDYLPLNITLGFNCVYMYMSGSSPVARIVGSGTTEQNCLEPKPVATVSAGALLEVKVSSTAGLTVTDADIPPVARWDRDPNNGQYYFGVKCGAVWCEVGAPNFVSSPSVLERLNAAAAPSEPNEGQRRRYAVKAWYDEQYLSVMSGNTAIPSKIKGTVIPDSGLIMANPSFDNAWVPVVRVLLDTTRQGNNPYKDKLNLAHTEPGQYNVVELCHSITGCPGMATPPTCTSPAYQSAATMSNQPQNWYAKITRVDNHVEYHCVIARSPPSSIASAVPRSARWHFVNDDDIIWEWCASGCCEEWSEK